MSIEVSDRSAARAHTSRFTRVFVAVLVAGLLVASTALGQGGHYEGDVVRNQDGDYVALLEYYPFDTAGSAESTEVVGTYETRREARKAARQAEKEANSFIADDMCPPLVFC